MPYVQSFNGQLFVLPSVGDPAGWGGDMNLYLQTLGNYALSQNGGYFPLVNTLNFGPTSTVVANQVGCGYGVGIGSSSLAVLGAGNFYTDGYASNTPLPTASQVLLVDGGLTVGGGSTTSPTLTLYGNTGTGNAVLNLQPNANAWNWQVQSSAAGVFSLNDATSGNQPFTILGSASPKVGINTSSPKSALDVNGGLAVGTYAGSNAAPSNSIIVSGGIGVGSNTLGGYVLNVGGTSKLGGAVTIAAGTIPYTPDYTLPMANITWLDNTTPDQLTIDGYRWSASVNNWSNTDVYIQRSSSTTSLGYLAFLGSNGSISNGGLALGYGSIPTNGGGSPIPAILINASNQVGIGTISPAGTNTKLVVAGSVSIGYGGLNTTTNALIVSGSAGFGTYQPQSAVDIGSGGLAVGSYAGTTAAPSNSIIVSGGIGIGATTLAGNALNVVGTGAFSSTVAGTAFTSATAGTNNAPTFAYTGSSPQSGLYFDGYGNLNWSLKGYTKLSTTNTGAAGGNDALTIYSRNTSGTAIFNLVGNVSTTVLTVDGAGNSSQTGNATITGNVVAAGGYRYVVFQVPILASALNGTLSLPILGQVVVNMPFAGSLAGISLVATQAQPTAGTLTATPVVNGTALTAAAATYSTSTVNLQQSYTRGTYPFSAGQLISLNVATSGWTQSTTNSNSICFTMMVYA